jgi:hypothetical protein
MEQHAIPRQITSFEFKLIGFMTLKQFLYIVIFTPMGYIVYMIFPIPFISILLGIAVGFLGVALAFIPINDRPLDIWIKNIWKRLNSPTQYTYHKHNKPITLLQNLYFVSDPHHVMAHIESQQMLATYLAKTKQTVQPNVQKKQVQQMLQDNSVPQSVSPPMVPDINQAPPQTAQQVVESFTSPVSLTPPPQPNVPTPPLSQTADHKPFFIGTIKNGKHIALPGILVYVKNQQNTPVRLLKTNQYGIFATFNTLPAGDYIFEIKDPKNSYLFDTMKIAIQDVNTKSIDIFSKELL